MSTATQTSEPQSLQYPLPGRVSFGWITEAWQLFMANAGPWIVGVLAMVALPVLAFIVFYVILMASVFSSGFGQVPGGHAPPPGFPNGPTPFPMRPGSPFTPFTLNTLFAGGFGRILVYELVAGLVMTVYVAFFYGALFRMAVRQVRGLPLEIKDVFRGWPLFGRMLGALFFLAFGAYGLEFVLSLPVLVVNHFRPLHPLTTGTVIGLGIAAWIVMFALTLALYGLLLPAFSLMADGDGLWTALRRSVRAMKAQWLPAAGFVFVMGLLVYASELACGVGLLATIPMVFLICALAYRDLVGMPNMVPFTPPGRPDYGPPDAGVWPPPPVQER